MGLPDISEWHDAMAWHQTVGQILFQLQTFFASADKLKVKVN